MTQVFGEGRTKAVTAIEAGPCTVLQIKTGDKDGYRAAKLGFGEVAPKKNKAKAGEKGGRKAAPKYRYMREFQLDRRSTSACSRPGTLSTSPASPAARASPAA
jgi:large subunit ribosomal protein L3